MPGSVSFSQYVHVECPRCRKPFSPEIYVLVDTNERPDLVQLIKGEILHCPVCPFCNLVLNVGMPLLVYRPDQRVPLIFAPVRGSSQEQREEQALMLFSTLQQRLDGQRLDTLTRSVYETDLAGLASVVDLDLDLLRGGRDQSLRLAMDQYLSCDTWEESLDVVERNDVLLRKEALADLRSSIKAADAAGDTDAIAMFTEHEDVLLGCVRLGVQNAFAAKFDGSGRTVKMNLAAIFGGLARSDSEQPQQAVMLARAGLDRIRRQDNEETWARMQWTLGDALLDLALSGQPQETDDAAWHFRAAMEFFSADRSLEIWAELNQKLYAAWRMTHSSPSPQQLLLAVICLASEADRVPAIVQGAWRKAWSDIRGPTDLPTVNDVMAALVRDGMIRPADDSSSYDVSGWVITSVEAGVNPYHAKTIDSALADYWVAELSSLEDARRDEQARAKAVSALLSVAPYLTRAREWGDLSTCLELLLSLDQSPAMIREVLGYWRLIADATGSHEELAELERVLTGVSPAETERQLRSARGSAHAAGDLLQEFQTGFDLAGLLRTQGRAREAFGINDQLPVLGHQARAGQWSMLAVEIQHLMIMHDLGEDVVDRVQDLQRRLEELQAADEPVDDDEPIIPHAAREVLLQLGVRAANDRGQWGQALAFSDDLLKGMRERGATDYEIAEAQHNRYLPLFGLRDLDAAEMVMLYCREVFETYGHPGDLAKTYGALGEIAWARGNRQEAIDFQKETLRHIYRRPDLATIAPAHKHFAQYLDDSDDEARLAHSLLAVITYRLCGEEDRYRSLLNEIADRHPASELLAAATPEWLAAVTGRVDGVDLSVLEGETGIDRAAVAVGLAAILAILRDAEASDAAWNDTLRSRWEPAVAAMVAAVNGDPHAAAALSEHLNVRELAPDWSRLVEALRRILDGERDAGALVVGLHPVDAAVISSTLDALAGRYQPRATVAELEAVTRDARQRHQKFLKMAIETARGDLLARDHLHEWVETLNRQDDQHELTTAVLAVVDGAREQDPRFLELTPAQSRLIHEIVDAIDTDAPETITDYAASNELYVTLSDPIGPSNDDIRAILRGDSDLGQAVAATARGIQRRLDAGDSSVPVFILELVLPGLLTRYEFGHALPLAELLVQIGTRDPSTTVPANLAKLVNLAGIAVARRIAPGGLRETVGSAMPSRTPGPFATLPSAEAVRQARRWVAAARALHPLVASEIREVRLILAEATTSRAAGDVEDAIGKLQDVIAMTSGEDPDDAGLHDSAAFLLAGAYINRGDLQAALQLCDQLLNARSGDGPLMGAEILLLRATALNILGRTRRAIADLDEAKALLGAGDDIDAALALCPVFEKLGSLYMSVGQLSAAAAAFAQGLEIARRTGHKIAEASMLMALGSLFGMLSTGYLKPISLTELNDTVEVLYRRIDPELRHLPTREGTRSIAETLLRRSADMFRAANSQHGWAPAINGLCNLLSDDQSDEAATLLNEALRAAEGDRLTQAVTLTNLSGRLRALGRETEADDALRQSLDIARTAGYFETAVGAAISIAHHSFDQGDLPAAESSFRDAVGMIESVRPHRPTEDLSRISFAQRHARAYTGLVDCLLARGADDEAFNIVQQAKSRALLELLGTSSIQPSHPTEGRFAELLAAEAEHLTTARRIHENPAAANRAHDALSVLYDEMATYDPEYVAIRRGTPATVGSVRDWLARQERSVLLAEYFTGTSGLTIFLLRPEWESVRVHSSNLTVADIHRGYQDFRRQVIQYRNSAGAGWTAISRHITEPLHPFLEPGDLVILAPHGTLHALPLHALQIGGVPLASRHPVIYTPSCGLLPLCQSPGKGTGQLNSCAAFGITYHAEAEAVAALFGTTPVPAAEVSADTIAARAADRDVAHFSCHAYFSASDPLSSGLYLKPGDLSDEHDPADLLTARQLMEMQLQNELVTVSACETGVQRALDGDELVGLARALLHAGAPSVIASLWPVDADTTRDFMVQFYTHLLAAYSGCGTIDKAEALRKAQRDMMESHGVRASYYWAPFVLIGDWS
jgi:tetratricopeptide (TPR) repeat protein